MENEIFDFEYKDEKYYYIRSRKADRIRVDKDKDGKPKFVGMFNCTKCGGKGSSTWNRDNGMCYDCHGLGYYTIILNTTKNKSTAERRLQAEKDRKEAEKDENFKKMVGSNLQKTEYVYGDAFCIILDTLEHSTYKDREYLKSKGARFSYDFNSWFVKKTETTDKDFKDYVLKEYKTKEHLNEYNRIDYTQIRSDVIEYKDKLEQSKGEVII